ncbi:MAG TPA: shikimate dehydrogenase [bacterium]
MKNAFSKTITGSSQVVFILGKSLSHSLSPLMQNAAFQHLKLPWVYLPFEVPEGELKDALGVMKGSNVRGANVTVPYKEKVLPFLDQVETEAEWLGSVNTLYKKGSKLCGVSTDGEGFLRSLGEKRRKLKGSQGLLLGAGGAAKAVAGALVKSGVRKIYVANRSSSRVIGLVKSIRKKRPRLELALVSLREAEKYVSRCDWVIQATSLGLKKEDPSPLSLERARPGTLAIELIYHRETAFLREAQKRRLLPLGGWGMLLHQGALSFEYWTGKKAPLKVMRKTLLRHLP